MSPTPALRPLARGLVVGLALFAAGTAAPRSEGVRLGTFELADDAVVDGDTIRVKGLDASLRLVAIDTEETFKDPKHRRAAEEDFGGYARRMRGESPTPVKYGTPLGEEAKRFARRFFYGVHSVRLEYDDPRQPRGYYGRHLVHVFAKKDGTWRHYNLEAVRAGMSPYFTKYGYSKRFHLAFVQAQQEAQAAKRGIWAPGAKHYPDYDERLAWWDRRARQIARFEKRYEGRPGYVRLGRPGAMDRLLAAEGRTVTVFGTIAEMRLDEAPYLVWLAHEKKNDFALVAFDEAELKKLSPGKWYGWYVYVRGRVSLYRGRPQMKAAEVRRIWME